MSSQSKIVNGSEEGKKQFQYIKKLEQFGMNLQKGDLMISNKVKYGIVLVGDTKAGKTATSHLLIQSILKVEKQDGEYYVVNPKDNPHQQAKIGIHERSETMIPNLFQVNIHDPKLKSNFLKINQDDKVLLIDTPGYGDSNGMITIIANGYYHYKLYTKIQNMKFIICVDKEDLNKTAKKFIDTLHQFTSSFRNYLQQKQNIWKSIGLIITKVPQADNNDEVLNDLGQRLKKIAENASIQLGQDQAKAIRQMIRFLVDNKKIFCIKKYTKKDTPYCPKLLDQINSKVTNWWTRKINQKGVVDMKPIRFSLISKIISLGSKQQTTRKQLIELISYYNLKTKNFIPNDLKSDGVKQGTICQVLEQIMKDAMVSTDSQKFFELMKTYVTNQYPRFDHSLESTRQQAQKQLFSLNLIQNDAQNMVEQKGKVFQNQFHFTIKKFQFISESFKIMVSQAGKQNERNQQGFQSFKNALCSIFKLFNQVSYLHQNKQQIIYKYCYLIYRIVQECKVFYHLIEEQANEQQIGILSSFTKDVFDIFVPLRNFMNWEPQYESTTKPFQIKERFLRQYNPDEETLSKLIVDELVIEFFTDPDLDKKLQNCNRLKLTISKLLIRYSQQLLAKSNVQNKKIFGKLISRLSKFRTKCVDVYNLQVEEEKKKQALILVRKTTVQLGKMLEKLDKIKQAIVVYKTINSLTSVCRLYEFLIQQADKKKQLNKYPEDSVILRFEYAAYLQQHFMQQNAIIVLQDAYDKSENMQNVEKGYELLNKHYQAQKKNELPSKTYQNQLCNKKYFQPFQQNLKNSLSTYENLQ